MKKLIPKVVIYSIYLILGNIGSWFVMGIEFWVASKIPGLLPPNGTPITPPWGLIYWWFWISILPSYIAISLLDLPFKKTNWKIRAVLALLSSLITIYVSSQMAP